MGQRDRTVDRSDSTVTASGKGQLKQLPMAKLKRYAKAYNIDVAGVLEKDEFIDRLIAARVCITVVDPSAYDKLGSPFFSRTPMSTAELTQGNEGSEWLFTTRE